MVFRVTGIYVYYTVNTIFLFVVALYTRHISKWYFSLHPFRYEGIKFSGCLLLYHVHSQNYCRTNKDPLVCCILPSTKWEKTVLRVTNQSIAFFIPTKRTLRLLNILSIHSHMSGRILLFPTAGGIDLVTLKSKLMPQKILCLESPILYIQNPG